MPRIGRERLREISDLMKKKEAIRNIGIVAHVDHGKTTLSDRLLSAGGVISDTLAGALLYLDYLEVEKRRRMTVKSASCTFIYSDSSGKMRLLVNLVDTPGHIDFSGYVSRSLRLIDSAILVVDAVEGVMVQTENYLRLALKEMVKPLLFINKIDRLILELRYSEDEIKERVVEIVEDINQLIESFLPEKYDSWKIKADRGLIIGSALDGWGVTAEIARETGVRLRDVMRAYESRRSIARKLPLHRAIMREVYRSSPSPVEAQRYRSEVLWGDKLGEAEKKAVASCSDEGPLIAIVGNIDFDSSGRPIPTLRVFSGSISHGTMLHLLGAGERGKVQAVYIPVGKGRAQIERILAGNIAVCTGLKQVASGETIVGEGVQRAEPIEPPYYLSEPVVCVTVEPESPSEVEKVTAELEKLKLREPLIGYQVDEETGEIIVHGVGELQLEIVAELIANTTAVKVGEPTVVLREKATTCSGDIAVVSPDGSCRLLLVCKPIEEANIDANAMRGENECMLKAPSMLEVDRDLMLRVLAEFSRRGPVCGEPVWKSFFEIKEIRCKGRLSTAQVLAALARGLKEAFLAAKPGLFEPVGEIEVYTPSELVGVVEGILRRRRSSIHEVSSTGAYSVIRGEMPISGTFGLSSELRAATSGRAIYNIQPSGYRQMERNAAEKAIEERRKKRGMHPLRL